MKIETPLNQALQLAEITADILRPACERIEIAGSIRREKPIVGDIEIVCVPKISGRDLFGTPLYDLPGLVKQVPTIWREIKGGDRFRQYDINGVMLDLFITTLDRWPVIFTIRTGHADFSHWIVTQRKFGGALPSNLKVEDGYVWENGKRLELKTETDFLEIVGLGWIEPKERTGPMPERLKWTNTK